MRDRQGVKMKPPEEIKVEASNSVPPTEIEVPGGELLLNGEFYSVPYSGDRFVYQLVTNPPMPELISGMWIESLDPNGSKKVDLVVEVDKGKMFPAAFYSSDNKEIDRHKLESITAVYERNEQEVWRR